MAGDAQPSRLDAQAHAPVIGKQVRQRLPWSGRAGAAGSAVFEGSQASRGGDSPQGFPLEASAGAKASTSGAAKEKARRPRRRRARLSACDQLAAGDTIASSCSITPGSTKTQGWLASIVTLNTLANT
ncbi:hypothetical protein D8B29_01025 [Verminephrobacter eiseniae]|nr:hypothetical protein [Verminephrobacter eiseniae]MCW5302667.1 hypothetical protein [Verminephrobacter eiseniae]MCW8178274.1 hypothetical protein [Verminephrobacter eiseniae]MCW8189004.1 hypothetical protein [Verminephrobacter eiseniae]